MALTKKFFGVLTILLLGWSCLKEDTLEIPPRVLCFNCLSSGDLNYEICYSSSNSFFTISNFKWDESQFSEEERNIIFANFGGAVNDSNATEIVPYDSVLFEQYRSGFTGAALCTPLE